MQALWILLSSFLFAMVAVFVKFAGDDLGAAELIFYRSLFAFVALAAFAFFRGWTLKTEHLFGHFKRSFAGYLSMWCWFLSLHWLTIGVSATISNTMPLFMSGWLAISAVMHKEPIPYKLIAAAILGFIGVVFIANPEGGAGNDLSGIVLALLAAFIAMWAYLQIKQLGQMKEPSWRIVMYFSFFCTVFSGLTTLFYDGGFSPVTSDTVMPIVGVSVFALVAQCVMTFGFGVGNLLLGACLTFSGIVFSTLLGMFFFGDTVTPMMLLGMILVIVAGITSTVITKKAEMSRR